MSFRTKLFITFIVYGSILALSTQILIFQLNERSIKKEALSQAAVYVQNASKSFAQYIKQITQRLHTIEDSKIFYKFYEDKNNPDFVNQLFLDITKNSPNIMQLRFINNDGTEVSRVDRNSLNSQPYIVPKNKLQNKKDRYYFKKVIKLKKSEYWYSKLDLNVEHGEIERPVKPVIRIGTPLFHNGKKVGILIINVFMKDFLYKITDSKLYNIYLIDKDGYVMVEPTHKLCWSRYLKYKLDLPVEFKSDISKILHSNKIFGNSYYAQKVFIQNSEEIRMVAIPNISSLQTKIDDSFEQFMWIVLSVFILSIPLSYFMSIVPSRLKQEVDELNRSMKDEVKEKDVLLSLFDLSDTVLFKWKNDDEWSVSSVSKSVKRLIGYSKEDFETHRIDYSKCIHHDDLKQVMDEVSTAVSEKKYFFTHEPYRIVTKKGDTRWILDHTVIVRDQNDEIKSFVGYLSDITDLKEKEFELQELARTDQLTKIHNRVYLDEFLHSQYYRYQRNGESCSIILLDIDHFKSVNDKHGHVVGDKVLIEFAKLLKTSIRKGDVVGRWGGEEFLIVLPHTKIEQAQQLAEKLRNKIESHYFQVVSRQTASFGVYCFEEGISIEKLVDNADIALYKAKEAGRNNVQIFKG